MSSSKRADIQGMRAIAVSAVVLFHVRPGFFPGGFVGVDVFFVISGFLITGALLREIDARGTLGLARFWGRRIRRLMPAATVVIIATLLAAASTLPMSQWATLAKEALASTLSVENWVLASNAVSYLQSSSLPSPFQHFWSLSVEEQFYILWPIVMLAMVFVARASGVGLRAAARYAVPFLAIASFAYSIVVSNSAPDLAYFSSFTRSWELLLGASLALWIPNLALGRRTGMAALFVGLGAIGASIWLINSSLPFPGFAALLPTLGAAAVIAGGTVAATNPVRSVLESRPVTFIGDISYSLYLWHWPVVVVTSAVIGSVALPIWAVAGIILVSISLAALSKRFIEDPFMRGARDATAHERPVLARIRRNPFLLATGFVAVTALSSALLYGNLIRIDGEQREFAKVAYPGARILDPGYDLASMPKEEITPIPSLLSLQEIERQLTEECLSVVADPSITTCDGGDPDGLRTVLIAGDSHAAQWLPALDELGKRHGWRVVVAGKQSCTLLTIADPAESYRAGDPVYPQCFEWNAKMRPFIADLDPDLVITTAAYYSYGHDVSEDHRAFDETMAGAYAAQYRFIADLGIPILALEETPLPSGFSAPECLSTPRIRVEECSERMTRALVARQSRISLAAEMEPRVVVANLNEIICPTDGCRAVIGNVVTYRDDNHLTAPFVQSLTWWVEQQVHGVRPDLLRRDSGVVALNEQ
jgi:peptidoglycan/LPS O-acetylase OafA/YrhL